MTQAEYIVYYTQREGIALNRLEKLIKELNITDEHFLQAFSEVGHCHNNIINNAFDALELDKLDNFDEIIKDAEKDSKSALKTDAERWEDEER